MHKLKKVTIKKLLPILNNRNIMWSNELTLPPLTINLIDTM